MQELKNNHIQSTNTQSSDNSFVIHYDRTLGLNHNIWITKQSMCVFPSSLLANIDRLTVDFCDNRGNKLDMGIILHYSMVINNIAHRVTIIFGKIDKAIICSITGIILELPISELVNINNWYSKVFNKIIGHVKCVYQRNLLNNNYEKLLKSITGLEIYEITKCDITNNIFLDVGIVQNELNTNVNYD
jgi:hypothetical protein